MNILSTISFLQGNKYKVEKLLGSGGFGNTYLATQVTLGRKVAIKEFFMKEYCDRDQTTSHVIVHTDSSRQIVERYKQKFLKEAQMIASLKNEYIIQIHDIFEENGTAYYVMEYVDGGSLKDKVEKCGSMTEDAALFYIRQIAEALSYLHKNSILHLDVKPANILVDKDNKAILIDFGISKHYDSDGGQTSTTPAGVSKGYAPIEQYRQGSISGFTPTTDVYSLGATLYFLLTGETPPEASIIYEDGLPSKVLTFSKSIQNVVTTSMSPRRKDRYQSMEELLIALPNNDVISFDAGRAVSKVEVITEETTILDQPSVKNVADENNTIQQQDKYESNGFMKFVIPIIAIGLVLFACFQFYKAGIQESNDKPVETKTSVKSDANQKAATQQAPTKVKASKIIMPASAILEGEIGKTMYLKYEITPTDAEKNKVSWKSSNTNVAKVNSDGAIVAQGNGTTIITATVDGISRECKLDVSIKTNQTGKMSISKTSLSLKVGESYTLKAYNYGSALAWESDNPKVATVSENGKIVAVGEGSTNIWAKGSEYKMCTVYVKEDNSYNYSSTKSNTSSKKSNATYQSVALHSTAQLYISGASVVRWESDNSNIAQVNENGSVYGKSKGKTNIWAHLSDGQLKLFRVTVY